jgi:hypothetical protein
LSEILADSSQTTHILLLEERDVLIALHQKACTVILITCCVAGFSCAAPQVDHFEATPQVVCEGEQAVIRWDASGELALAVRTEPEPSAEDGCAAVGRDTLALTLVARQNGKEAQRQVEIVQLRHISAEPIALRTQAIEGTDVVARGEKNAALWSHRVEVATVATCGHRTIYVRHADKTASLPVNGTASDALAGTTLGGVWELRSPLSAEEQQEPSLRPRELKVLAKVHCKSEQS